MKAILTNYRQSPRKVRLVANLLSGKSVKAAETELHFLPKRAAAPIAQLLASAIANARTNSGIEKDNLKVKSIIVDKGTVMKRHMPRARGSASRINKRSSHITVLLAEIAKPQIKNDKLKIINEKPKTKAKSKVIKTIKEKAKK